MPDIDELVRDKGAFVRRDIFSDPDVYRHELQHVFGRSWLFLAHDSQLPAAGDYLTTYMGCDPVIVIRQPEGDIRALLNTCAHRGTQVCISEEGNAKSFSCPYHGWTYDVAGDLVGVPRDGDDGYHGELDKSRWSLRRIRVESYKGLHFGNFDPTAPSLREFLGDFAWYLDAVFDPLPSGVEFVGGTMRIRLRCNWKIAAENIVADTYHVLSAHAVSVRVCMGNKPMEIGIEGARFQGRRGRSFCNIEWPRLECEFRRTRRLCVIQGSEALDGLCRSATATLHRPSWRGQGLVRRFFHQWRAVPQLSVCSRVHHSPDTPQGTGRL